MFEKCPECGKEGTNYFGYCTYTCWVKNYDESEENPPKSQRETIIYDTWTFAPGKGRATLAYPTNMSAEDLESFKSWLELQIRKISRLTPKEKEKEREDKTKCVHCGKLMDGGVFPTARVTKQGAFCSKDCYENGKQEKANDE